MINILKNLFGVLSGNLQGLVDNIIPLGLAAFLLALGFFAIRYLGRRRQLLNDERMAALIKGLHYAGVSRDLFARPRQDSRDHLLRGLRWLFGAAGISGALYGYESLQPTAATLDAWRAALAGVLPAAIGLAHLIFSWICSLRDRLHAPPATSAGSYYRLARTARRRY